MFSYDMRARFCKANLARVDLRGATLREADLMCASLRRTYLGMADFSSAILDETDFRGASFGETILSNLNLSSCGCSPRICSASTRCPIARTYWRWSLTSDPFAVYQPASSAVGMYQMTDAAFAEVQGYCILHHTVVESGCSATAFHSRVVPRHATEITAVFLDRKVTAILGHHRNTRISRQQREELAAVIHLCGTGPAKALAHRGFRLHARGALR